MKTDTRRIENQSSRTAAFICMYRAASYLEKNKFYQSNDYIAPNLLPGLIKFLLSNRLVNFRWPFFPRGIYEYVIARTKFIDDVFEDSIKQGIEQIVLFGAGFDTRAIRFADINIHTKIFELDTIYTQTAKIEQFKKRNILLPKNTIFIPIDFHVDSITEKLAANGFNRNKTTLFILEGIIQYLKAEVVDELFKLLYELSVPGSRVVFDYIYASVLRKENSCYGEEDIYKRVNSAREPWLFGIEKGEIEEFVSQYKFNVIQDLDPETLENMFFRDKQNHIVGKINGTHCIAYIKKLGET